MTRRVFFLQPNSKAYGDLVRDLLVDTKVLLWFYIFRLVTILIVNLVEMSERLKWTFENMSRDHDLKVGV